MGLTGRLALPRQGGRRSRPAEHFSKPQKLHDRIADLLHFVWSEIESSPGEQLVLQEMTLYVLRNPHAEHLAAEKDKEIFALYADSIRSAEDVTPADEPTVIELSNFIYTAFVGILTQWLATHDAALLVTTTNNLIAAAQHMARDRIASGSSAAGRRDQA